MCPSTLLFPVVPTSYTIISITEQPRGIKRSPFEMEVQLEGALQKHA